MRLEAVEKAWKSKGLLRKVAEGAKETEESLILTPDS